MSDERRPVPAGWHACPAEPLPEPTAAPALFAFGVTLCAWGIVSSLVVSVIGGAVLSYALLHWIGQIRHDARSR
jgi:hypothetical protein